MRAFFQTPMENLIAAVQYSADASSSMPSSSASTSYSQYDIFLNHRGPDVKDTFASHLYNDLTERGLRVFFDRDEMEKGGNILSQIEHAISVASVHIAIFSPRYAESSWCLDELVHMKRLDELVRKKNSRGTILPVFFKVHPSQVRRTVEDGAYAEALQVLQKKTTDDSKPSYSSATIQNWRNALSYAANLSGFVHGEKDDEGKLLHDVVQSVLEKVPKPPLDVATYPTGLDLKVKEFEEFEKTVLSHPQEAKVVGIVGVGGVGKTTLAKEFFNLKRSSYSSSSFLFDVRETVNKMSLPYLQKKLLTDLKPKEKDIKIESRDEGVGILKRYLSFCHSLIILDDVDNMKQLETVLPIKKFLRPDSLILVTSRNSDVLKSSEVFESSIYNLKGMNVTHAKELFCRHAFRQPDPLPEFADLVNRFVTECDGLPLSLKVFGALVCGQKRSVWQEILVDKILPITEIHDRLKISYDSLSPQIKEIFLDVACFFLGEDGDKGIRIWGKVGLQNLQDRCLLEVDIENKLKMHDHIRDMGRKIAEEGSMPPLPRRLWRSSTEIIDDLFHQSSPVRGIKMVSSSNDPFHDNQMFWRPTSRSSHISISKRLEMKHLFSNSPFPGMRNLQLVATEEDHLEDIMRREQPPHLIWLRWYRCSHSSLPHSIPMKNLKVLEIEASSLKTLWPHQSQAVPLQLRELNICAPLSDIPKSIGQLKYLERIAMWNFSEAVPLERLPNEFCCLSCLKYLAFKGFSRIVSLPDSFGDLRNLRHIDLEGASNLQMLPNSFGNLTRLKHLSLIGCENLTMLTLGNIITLEYLNLSSCKQLKELPRQVAHQRSLKRLYLKETNLNELPSGMGDLRNLEVLELGSDLLEALPRGLGEIKSLKFLSLYNSPQLKCLPDSIGQLTQVISLFLWHCGIEYLTQELLKMSNLEVLEIIGCPLQEHPFKKEVEGVRETLLSLEGERALNDRCLFRLKSIHLSNIETEEVFFDPGVFPALQRVIIWPCDELRQIGWLCGLPKLRDLETKSGVKVEELPRPETWASLEKLTIFGCQKLQSVQGLGQLTKLRELVVYRLREISELPGVEYLTSLEKLTVRHCRKLQSIPGLGQLTKLRELDVSGLREIQELPGVEYLTSLESLTVWDCDKIQGLWQLTKLIELKVYRCCEMQELQGVEYLIYLEKLTVRSCQKLQSIQGLGHLTQLLELYVNQCPEIQELPGLEHLKFLETLNVSGLRKLTNIQGLGQLTKIRELDVNDCCEITELSGLEYLTSLTKLNVSGLRKLKSIRGLGQLTQIRELDVSVCHEIIELPGLEQLNSLEKLNASGLENLRSIQGLGQLPQLRQLDVSGCNGLRELPGVEYLMSLKMLNARRCPKLQWSEGVLEQLRQRLKDGFIFEEQRKKCGCLQFLQSVFESVINCGQTHSV